MISSKLQTNDTIDLSRESLSEVVSNNNNNNNFISHCIVTHKNMSKIKKNMSQ